MTYAKFFYHLSRTTQFLAYKTLFLNLSYLFPFPNLRGPSVEQSSRPDFLAVRQASSHFQSCGNEPWRRLHHADLSLKFLTHSLPRRRLLNLLSCPLLLRILYPLQYAPIDFLAPYDRPTRLSPHDEAPFSPEWVFQSPSLERFL